MNFLRAACWLLGVCAFLTGALLLLRAINPTASSALNGYGIGLLPQWSAFALGVAAIIVSLIASMVSHSPSNRAKGSHQAVEHLSKTSLATTIAVIGAAMAAVAMFLTATYPSGIVGKPTGKAPFGGPGKASGQIDLSIGTCSGQWVQISQADIPGIAFGVLCQSNETVYAEFSQTSQHDAFMSNLPALTPTLMRSYASAEYLKTTIHYYSISGPKWVAITPKATAVKLQDSIGGQLTDIN